ncbi:MAG TPA: glycine cleavage system protein H [Terriglobales bacterium]|nr:glycine cleavage system protein H [Terriglobales bacterium]
MSILFVLLTFLVIMTVSYFVRHGNIPVQVGDMPADAHPVAPSMTKENGFEIPKGFCFHPGHTWVYDEGRQNARVGLDSFATHLMGKIDRVEVANLNRWVRQGQKVCTVTGSGSTVEFMAPVEGVVVSINHEVLRDPSLLAKDPYKDGWVCVIKAPDVDINKKNLLQAGMVSNWMQNSMKRLQAYAAPLGAATADGGVPVEGLLAHVDPNVRREMIHEFFLN